MNTNGSGPNGGKPIQLNVLGTHLRPCSTDPVTGFFRNGRCDTGPADVGSHTVCCVMTTKFLEYSKRSGNDLSTPNPEFGFAGLQPGDCWCVCAPRWKEALDAGFACPVKLECTHMGALQFTSLQDLRHHALPD